jgi:hypothetical protein
MSSELVTPLERSVARRSWRVLAIGALGPVTSLAGLVWAAAQPYRLTILDPGGKGFWDLAVQPPLLVVVVGIGFALTVARGLAADLEGAEDDAAG